MLCGESISKEQHSAERRFMGPGYDLVRSVEEFKDARLAALADYKGRCEVLQAIGRARLATNPGCAVEYWGQYALPFEVKFIQRRNAGGEAWECAARALLSERKMGRPALLDALRQQGHQVTERQVRSFIEQQGKPSFTAR